LAPLGTRDFAESLYFRFSNLLPLPHLLFVFTSVSSSFSCIGLYFGCIGLSFSCIVYLLVVSVHDIDVFVLQKLINNSGAKHKEKS
jgi:hypothetical protein